MVSRNPSAMSRCRTNSSVLSANPARGERRRMNFATNGSGACTDSGSAGWLRDWGHGWNSALFYYGDNALNGYRFERVDTRIAKRIPLGKAQLQLAGVLQQRLDHEPTTFVDNNYDERRVVYFSAELEF